MSDGVNSPTWESDCGTVKLWLGDCVEAMKSWDAGAVDAVFDPPYGLQLAEGRRLHAYKSAGKHKGKIGGNGAAMSSEYGETDWDRRPLTVEQWDAIRRVSARQIVFGYEYLLDVLGRAPRVLCWDKKCKNGWDDHFSDFELAWCSEAGRSKMFRHMWMGMLRDSKEKRLHPTQKPVPLMEWCFGFGIGPIVFDPFMGSGTTGVAAVRSGRSFLGSEICVQHFDTAQRRIKDELRKVDFLEPQRVKDRQAKLFSDED